ncbi:hypothetical protein BYT27DRAFT_7253375 [Phlegmacium glaucopus]|nr:hypothetical protein BYT27DRAFT_7253375 [Phlegmacium glaucopus]
MNNLLKGLFKKGRKDSPFVPSPTVSREVCEGSEGQQDTAQMTTFFQGAHHFIAHGPFTEIQGDQIVNIFHPPPRMAGEMLDADCILGNPQSRISRDVDDVPKFNLFYDEFFKTHKTSQVKSFQHGSIVCTKVFRTKLFRHGQIYHAEMVEDGKPVLWKKYDEHNMSAIKEFKRELNVWKGMSHPFLVQFLGRSTPGSSVSFIVLTGATDVNIRHVLTHSFGSKDASAAIIDALVNVAGIFSGLHYIASRFCLGYQELTDCMDTSNILFDPNNRAIIGRNLVDCVPGQSSKLDTVERFLVLNCQVFYFMDHFLFGDHGVGCHNSWAAVGEKRKFSHLRILLRLMGWSKSMEFQAVEERISNLTELVEIQPQPLTFPQIREAVLSIKGIQHGTPFHPSIYWEVKLYDVGYVRGEEFIFLFNSQDTSNPNYTPIVMEDEFITYPDVSAQMKIFDNGVSQFEFHNTCYATVDRRCNIQNLADSALAFKFFLSIAPSIVESYRDKHQIQVSDLIMITGTIDHPSASKIIFSDEAIAPMEHLYFYCLLPGSQPWGYWSADDRPTGPQNLEGATIPSITAPQMVNFIQLQEEDFQSDST